MEPQLEGCGKLVFGEQTSTMRMLQWSRNLRVAESGMYVLKGGTFKPLQWSRNLRVAESESQTHMPNLLLKLQWSRNLRVAESGIRPDRHPADRRFNGAAT